MAGNIPIFVPHEGCPQQCSFCNQRTISGSGGMPTPEEAAALCGEALAHLPVRVGKVEIAFFGGSFTAIPRERMVGLLKGVQSFRAHPRVKGIRISTRPDAVDGEILDLLEHYGVTAIELGAQSMDDRVLELNRRGHDSASVVRASRLIRSRGFSLGLQMMTGLYGSSREKDLETGRALAELEPDTMRIYPTVVLSGTQLEEEMLAGRYHPPGVEETVPLCADLLELFEQRGIQVIRLGLQTSELLESQVVGGCFHPALGELCQNERYFRRLLAEAEALGEKRLLLRVSRRKASQVLGQKRRNIRRLEQAGCRITVEVADQLLDYTLEVEAHH